MMRRRECQLAVLTRSAVVTAVALRVVFSSRCSWLRLLRRPRLLLPLLCGLSVAAPSLHRRCWPGLAAFAGVLMFSARCVVRVCNWLPRCSSSPRLAGARGPFAPARSVRVADGAVSQRSADQRRVTGERSLERGDGPAGTGVPIASCAALRCGRLRLPTTGSRTTQGGNSRREESAQHSTAAQHTAEHSAEPQGRKPAPAAAAAITPLSSKLRTQSRSAAAAVSRRFTAPVIRAAQGGSTVHSRRGHFEKTSMLLSKDMLYAGANSSNSEHRVPCGRKTFLNMREMRKVCCPRIHCLPLQLSAVVCCVLPLCLPLFDWLDLLPHCSPLHAFAASESSTQTAADPVRGMRRVPCMVRVDECSATPDFVRWSIS